MENFILAVQLFSIAMTVPVIFWIIKRKWNLVIPNEAMLIGLNLIIGVLAIFFGTSFTAAFGFLTAGIWAFNMTMAIKNQEKDQRNEIYRLD